MERPEPAPPAPTARRTQPAELSHCAHSLNDREPSLPDPRRTVFGLTFLDYRLMPPSRFGFFSIVMSAIILALSVGPPLDLQNGDTPMGENLRLTLSFWTGNEMVIHLERFESTARN